MTVQEYINTFAMEHDNPYLDEVVLKWINLVEQNVYADNIKDYRVQYYAQVINTYQFTLPAEVNFTEVKSVHVNGVKYKKKDVRAYKENRTYWYEGGKLCIYPACTETDPVLTPKIKMVYQYIPVSKLIANIATDTLLIPDRFIDVYDYYLMAKIAHLARESNDYDNNMTLYNAAVGRLMNWWEDNRPQSPETDIIASDDDLGYSNVDFDSEV